MTHTFTGHFTFPSFDVVKGCYKDLSLWKPFNPDNGQRWSHSTPQAPSEGGNSRCSIRYHVINDLKTKSAGPRCSMNVMLSLDLGHLMVLGKY